MKNKHMFMRRTGKVLAVSRAILGVVFLLALWLDPVQPVRAAVSGYLLLSAFLLWSAALIVVAWRSWWMDFRLAGVAHAVDILAFMAAVYLTETGNGDFSSPFMAFAAFLLIGSTLRWGWSGVAWTAFALIVANGLMGAVLTALHIDLDMYRYGRRQSYMIVLSIMMVWLTGDRYLPTAAALPNAEGVPGERHERVLACALAHARDALAAHGAALAFARDEEPWTEIVSDRGGRVVAERVGPAEYDDQNDAGQNQASCPPMLFSTRRKRAISLQGGKRLQGRIGPCPVPLAAFFGVEEGIAVCFETAAGHGQLLVWGIADLCADDLYVAAGLAREIGLAVDREDMAALGRRTAVTDVRHALARDLHDSVAQFLAGTLFRLEALRRWIREGNDPNGEIDAMKEALRREQGQLRVMIDRLRRGVEGDRSTDLADELGALMNELGQHWHISTRLDCVPQGLPVPMHLAYELRQVVREAVANAVRHGASSQVSIAMGYISGGTAALGGKAGLRMLIADNGRGFPQEAGHIRPRSICERIEALGGCVAVVESGPEPESAPGTGRGARLEITLPLGVSA